MRDFMIIIGVGVGATLLAAVIVSFFFPGVWSANDAIKIKAPAHTVHDLMDTASQHTEWNPWVTRGTITASSPDSITTHIVGARGEGDITIVIDSVSPTLIEATVTNTGGDQATHRWRLEESGRHTTHVQWSAYSNHKRFLTGRLMNVLVSRWVEEQVQAGLEALKDAAEQEVIQ